MTDDTDRSSQPFSVVVGELLLAVWRRRLVVLGGVVLSAVAGYFWAARMTPVYEIHATVAAWLEPVAGQPRTSASVEVLSTAARSGAIVSKALAADPDARAHGLSTEAVAAHLTVRAEAGTDVRGVTLTASDPEAGARFLNRLLATLAAETTAAVVPPPSAAEEKQIQDIYDRMLVAEKAWMGYRPEPGASADQFAAVLAALRQVDLELAEARAVLTSLQASAGKWTGPGGEALRADVERQRAQIAGLQARRGELELSMGGRPGRERPSADMDPIALRARFEGLRALYQETVTTSLRAQVSPPAASRLRVKVADEASAAAAIKVAPRPWRSAMLAAGAGLLLFVFLALVANAITEMTRTWPQRSA